MIQRLLKTRWAFPLAFCLLAALLQLDLLVAGRGLGVYRNEDENWYGIVLSRVQSMECRQGIPVTFVHQDRKNFHTCEYFKVLDALSPVREPLAQAAWLKASAKVLTLGLFCLLSLLVLGTPWAGLLVGAWNFLDPGIESFKPALVLLKDLVTGATHPFTQAMRFISPLHYFLPGFGAALCLVAWIRADRADRRGKGLAQGGWLALPLVVCLWLLALTPFYAWLPFYFLYACLGLYALYFCRRATVLAMVGVLALGLGITAIYLRAKSGFPFEEQVLPRSGFFKGVHDPIFILHKGLMAASLLLGGISYQVFQRRALPAVLIGAGFFIFQNINVLTGYELQNFHFKDYLGPFFLTTTAFFVIWRWPARRLQLALGACVIVAAGFGHYAYSLRNHPNSLLEIKRQTDHAALIEYAREELRGKKGFCGPWDLALPVLAGARCYTHHLLMTYPLSDSEVMRMHIVRFRLLGLGAEEVRATLVRARERAVVGDWNFGVNPEWVSHLPPSRRYWHEAPRFIPRWVEEYATLPDEQLRAEILDFDFLVLRRNHPLVQAGWFAPLRELHEYGIYRAIR